MGAPLGEGHILAFGTQRLGEIWKPSIGKFPVYKGAELASVFRNQR